MKLDNLILAPVVLALIVLTIVIIITMFQSEEPEWCMNSSRSGNPTNFKTKPPGS
jgi:hypothetical protein